MTFNHRTSECERSLFGHFNALQELAKMMLSEARRINGNGDQEDVPVDDLKNNDLILVRPGEKVPADGTIVEEPSNQKMKPWFLC